MREKLIEGRLTTLAKRHGFLALKWRGRKGVPDRVVIHNGKIYLVELKSTEGELEPIQEYVHSKILEQNVQPYTLASVEDVKDFVERMLRDAL